MGKHERAISPSADSDPFYDNVAMFSDFESLMDEAHYRPLPDDWMVGLTDVVQSTRAIAENRYKTVNMAGAAAIAALANALKGRHFPFVFGGDGASFAVPPVAIHQAREALAATAAWVRDDLGLMLRVALVPVAAIRAQGLDIRVARFAPSPNVAYAMFSGGGLRWAESAMKAGAFAVPPAVPGTRPDLAGLSCRFQQIPASRGLILAFVVVPAMGADPQAFRRLIEDVVAMLENSPDAVAPVPEQGPVLRWPPPGLELEVRASRGAKEPILLRRAKLLLHTFVSYLIFRLGIRVGRFAPAIYLHQLVENSDFRKYDDCLRMVLDCTERLADTLEQRLAKAFRDGTAHYGMHRQGAAMMTCFTPSVYMSNHIHFIDGASGGYASAASALKAATAG
jgi:Protein of unknown function (DUF3095)